MSQLKKYLGDGVYADYDGFHIVLTTEDGINITNTIYLDLQVLDALQKFTILIKDAGRYNGQNLKD